MDKKEQKPLTKIEKLAIGLNVAAFAIVVVSGIIRILVECNVISSFKNSVAYAVVDGLFIFAAVVMLVWAYVLEKRIKKLAQEEDNKNKPQNKRKK